MRIAVRQAAPAILASAGTVVAALLCLMVAEVNTTAGLGPVGAMGIAVAAIAMLTVLPALLLIGGRRAFWPFVPRYGSEDTAARGAWLRLGRWIEPRHRRVWIGTTLAARGAVARRAHARRRARRARTGSAARSSRCRARRSSSSRSRPARARRRPCSSCPAVTSTRRSRRRARRPWSRRSASPRPATPGTRFAVTLTSDPFSKPGFESIEPLRDDLRAAAGDAVLVGGPTAEEADVRAANERDTRVLVPLVLLVVFAILVAAAARARLAASS